WLCRLSCRSSLHVPCRGENTRSKCPFKFDHNNILADEKENGPEDTTQDDDMKQSIVKWLFELNAKQREVLARRFGLLGYEAATLEDVGREIGLTRERVRQIQVEGLRRLREILQGQGLNIEALFRE
ncbi:hypothetical protein NGE00_18580, partial [Klebsiella pneumoniae]|nr:hypothetical protein [Klebsiella pneumoniae]